MKLAIALAGASLLLPHPFSPVPQNEQRPATKVASPPGIEVAAWQKAGPAHRWRMYREHIDTQRGQATDWMRFLEQSRDFETLEAIAIYDGYQMLFQKGKPGEILYRLEAPQWMRVALWNLDQRDSHSVEAARSPLESNPQGFLAWADKYPQVRRLGGADLLSKLRGQKKAAKIDQLPPHDPVQVVLAFLDAPKELAVLKAGDRFEPRQRYRFQVLRAIGAVSVAAQFGDAYRAKLLRLTQHPDDLVRRKALLEFTEFPGARVPATELLKIADDPKVAAADRRIAALAMTYSDHPSAFLAAHRIPFDKDHPGHQAVAERLFSIGTSFTNTRISKAELSGLPEDQRTLLHRIDSGNKSLLQNNQRKFASGRLVFLIAWSQANKHPLAAAVRDWAVPILEDRAGDARTKKPLQDLLKNPGRSGAPPELHQAISEELKAILR